MHIVTPAGPLASNWTFRLQLDGRVSALRNNVLKKGHEYEFQQLCEEYVDSSTTSTFKFGTLQLVDDEASLRTESRKLGEIRLLIYTVESFSPGSPREVYRDNTAILEKLHENAKKAMIHSVQ